MGSVSGLSRGDAALQELLASMARHSGDEGRRGRLLDHMRGVPPIAEWPADHLDALQETCAYIVGLARLARELRLLAQEGEP